MAQEIERKFLVRDHRWRDQADAGEQLVQGYLVSSSALTVRVRIRARTAWLTLKGASVGISRSEFEYPIPLADAEAMLAEFALGPVIDKVRHRVPCGEHLWEVDVFAGENAGLVLAEIELTRPDEHFEHPPWVGSEVSADPRYYNVNLARHPYRRW
ncbi:MAG: CYTH domain-containing protein [Chromatiaceae bacterium]|nr:MAG: CYTH domain-containing protein [Chromatiaceae bacterium]